MPDDSSDLTGAQIRARFGGGDAASQPAEGTSTGAPSGADIRQRFKEAVPPGGIDPITGRPFQYAGPAGPGPVAQSTGTPIREDMVPGAGTQAIISLAGDPEQKRRIAAAQLFPNLKPLEAQSRVFYGPNGRLAAINDDGTSYYVDPAASGAATDPYSPGSVAATAVPRNPLAYAASGAGPALPAAGAAVGSALATPGVAPAAGAAGAAAGDVVRQAIAAKFDPGSSKYDPKATLTAAGQGALTGATAAAGQILGSGGPAISGVTGEKPPAFGSGPAMRNPAITDAIPTTSDAMKTVARPYYKMAEASGAGSTSQGTDAIIGIAEDKVPTGLVGEARGGAVSDFAKWVQQFKGKPLTYKDLDNIDDELSQRVSADYKFPNGNTPQGRDLFDIQTAIRQRLLNPQQGDLTGDQNAFAARKAGDQAWSQAKKAEDVERMWAKAQDTQNADTSFANQWRNYKYSAKARGWSDEEIAAGDAAATSGREAPLMHILGSRLLTVGATTVGTALGGAAGSMFGPLGTYVGAALGGPTAAIPSYIAGRIARTATTGATERGVQNALAALGRGTPPSVLTPP